jgi:hypothetical protein
MLSLQALERCPSIICGLDGDIDMTKRGPKLLSGPDLRHISASLRHLPSDVTSIRERNHTADNAGTEGILQRLHQTWYLRGT